MMKKIKRLKDIEHEKLRLRVLQLEQEKQLHQTWGDLKKDNWPLQYIQRQWQQFNQSNQEPPPVETLVNYGTAFLSRHFGEWAGNTLHEKLDKLAEALKHPKSNN